MKVRPNPGIKEESGELRKMLLSGKDGRKKERIHIPYLFRTGICETIGDIAEKTGRNRNTVSGRIKKYEAGGTGLLCEREASPGRSPLLTEDETDIIKQKLCDPAGSGSYHKIYEYVENETGKKINKKTLYIGVTQLKNSIRKCYVPEHESSEMQ